MSRAAEKPVLSVVMGTYNRGPFLRNTVDSVRGNRIRVPYEIIVVDGGSSDGALEWLITQRDVVTIVQHNRAQVSGQPAMRRSWGYFMNLGFRLAQGKYILMLSDDCLLLPEAVNRGLARIGRLEADGRRIGGVAFYYRDWPVEADYYVQLTLGGKLMVNHGLYARGAMEEVGWVDEDRYRFYKADGDLSLKLWRAGYEVVDCPDAFVEHHAHANPTLRGDNMDMMDADRRAYLSRWSGIFYHPDHPDPRGRVTVRFDDPHRTAEKVWAAHTA